MNRQREGGLRHTVVIPLFDGVQSLGFSGPADVFSAANESDRGIADRFRYEVLTASLDGAPIHTSSGLTVMPDCAIVDVTEVGTVILPGADGIPVIDGDDRAGARADIFTFIETYYNCRRPEWGYLTPHETRRRHQGTKPDHALAA